MFNFFRKFGLTKRDFILIVSLVLTISAGLIIKWSGWKDNINRFNYSNADSVYETKLTTSFKQLENSPENKEKLKQLKAAADSLTKVKDSVTGSHESLTLGKKLNINTSFSSELQLLPGIGKVMAERIVDYREQNGDYNRIEDIMYVKGIGEKKFDRIKNLITVDSLNNN
jgi:comEA protein